MGEPTVTFVTTTSYGSWLPGDTRGHVHDGRTLPPSPMLERHIRTTLTPHPVLFTPDEQMQLSSALLTACDEFDYRLLDVSIESWHLHWIVIHSGRIESMVGRLKNRMRQRLNRGRIWTEGYWHRILMTDEELWIARDYIRRHDGCRITAGKPTAGQIAPGFAGGSAAIWRSD